MVLKYYKKHWKVGQKKRQEQQERNRAADEERKRKADEKKLKDEAEYRKRMEEAEKMKNVAQKKRKSQTKKLARSRLAKKRITKRQIMKIKRIKSLLHLAMGAPQTNTPGHRRLARWRSLFMCQYVPPGVKAKEIVCDIGGDTLKLGRPLDWLQKRNECFAKREEKEEPILPRYVEVKAICILASCCWRHFTQQGNSTLDTTGRCQRSASNFEWQDAFKGGLETLKFVVPLSKVRRLH
ncbi:unnamed protein product [Durusdinium trenchii]|uniref:Coiled-coil domain-containing protein 86 n=1 Tax=Durusdinium trenchii TaxID=1381693 RepID=A0ABP0NZT5_9DINO